MITSDEQTESMLAQLDKQALAGALYWLCLGKVALVKAGGSHANVSFTIGEKFLDFAKFKKAILETVTSVNMITMTNQATTGKVRNMRVYSKTHHHAQSRNHPKLTKVWARMIEPTGRKMMDKYAMSVLNPIGLAILYQDHGSVLRKSRENPDVILDNLVYSGLELNYMAKSIVDKWGLIFRVGKAKFGHRLRLRRKDNQKFFDLVEPYIVSSKARLIVRDGPAVMAG